MNWIALAIVLGAGLLGGLVNVFLDDTGFHLPRLEHGVWRPGYLGVLFVGMMAAAGSWLMATSGDIFAAPETHRTLSYGSIATALLIGFGGAKWFRSEGDKDIYKRTAAIAAERKPNAGVALEIAGAATPMQALNAATRLPEEVSAQS